MILGLMIIKKIDFFFLHEMNDEARLKEGPLHFFLIH